MIPAIIRRYASIFLSKPEKVPLGRWNLKHNCTSEDIVVFGTNRDHCGDALCGDPEEYKKLAPKTVTKQKRTQE